MKIATALDFKDYLLQDDSTDFGGIAHIGETLEEFMEEIGEPLTTPMPQVNNWLVNCGIEPIQIYKVGDLVIGKEVFYSQGRITEVMHSQGTKKGLLYCIKDKDTFCSRWYFDEDITPLVMPTCYESCAIELLAKDFYESDKRILSANMSRFEFDKGSKSSTIKVSITLGKKLISKEYKKSLIKKMYHTWLLKDKPRWQYDLWRLNKRLHRPNTPSEFVYIPNYPHN